MSEFPEDIMREAKETIMMLRWHMIPIADFEHAMDIVALAILAERKRCAALAYETCAKTRHVTLGDASREAIMKGGEA